MKKKISMFIVTLAFTFLIFNGTNFADPLDNINISTDKNIVRPDEDVTVAIDFGVELGSYTFDILYDKNLFTHMSTNGGTVNIINENDTSDIARVNYFDTNAPRSNMSVTFKAKSGITTSNPTEFKITANGLAAADPTTRYDSITTPITKNITVEPQYINYVLDLNYIGEIVKQEEKIINISYSSPMGHYYSNARLVADVITPEGASAQLLAIDLGGLEYDILQNGWGDAQGYGIGGANVIQELTTIGKFSDAGEYAITLSLIDRHNSDSIIATETFNLIVKEEATKEELDDVNTEKKPQQIDKLGSSIDFIIVAILLLVLVFYVLYEKKKERK